MCSERSVFSGRIVMEAIRSRLNINIGLAFVLFRRNKVPAGITNVHFAEFRGPARVHHIMIWFTDVSEIDAGNARKNFLQFR